ncbi:YrdB family protein, partial [Paeniglutamicibacter sp.]|uniref:YrdB family protein n=1 Tax=Paeniglutamicibacter sp. TaxID=1934391 RepID=UPI00398900BA
RDANAEAADKAEPAKAAGSVSTPANPAAAAGPEAAKPITDDAALNESADTGDHAKLELELDAEGDGSNSEAVAETPAEPVASSEPAEMSADPGAASVHQRAGATGGTIMALMIVSFILEVALLGALGIWAMTMLPFSPVVAVIIGVLPVLVFWVLFMSPKANLRLPQPYHAVVAHLLFAAGSGLLAIAGQSVLALCMGVLTAISLALTVAVSGQHVESRKAATGRRAAR